MLACSPSEQAFAERRAREVSVEAGKTASQHARRILRQTQRELQKLEIETRNRAKGLRQRGRDTLDKLDKLDKLGPPAATRPPTHSDTALLCKGDSCTIDRGTVMLYAKEPMMLLHEGAVLPIAGGGLQILSLRADGLGKRLGLRTGDALVSVDDASLTAILSDPQTQRKLSVKRQWVLTIRRDDQLIKKSIELR